MADEKPTDVETPVTETKEDAVEQGAEEKKKVPEGAADSKTEPVEKAEKAEKTEEPVVKTKEEPAEEPKEEPPEAPSEAPVKEPKATK